MIVYMIFTHIYQHLGFTDTRLYMGLEHCLYFFMAWFFFKAGMYFKPSDNKAMIHKSSKRLLLPFIIWSSIGHIVYCAVHLYQGNLALNMAIPIKQFVMSGSISGNLPLWFLITLFFCRALLNWTLSKHIKTFYVTIGSISIAFILHLIGIKQPFYIANTALGLFFMSVGYIEYREKLISITPVVLLSCVMIYIVGLFYPSFVGMRSNTLVYGNYLLWSLCSLAGITLFNYVARYRVLEIMGLHYIGRHSMPIYCAHWIPLLFL